MSPTATTHRASTIRVLIAADHVVMRAGLVQAVTSQRDMAVVAEVESGEKAIEAYRAHRPDVAILDLRMPGLGGLAATRALREEFSGARIVVFSNDPRLETVEAAMAAGADGFVGHNISLAQLVQAIRQVRAGEGYLPPEFAGIPSLLPRSQPSASETDGRSLDIEKCLTQALGPRPRGQTARLHSVKKCTPKRPASAFAAWTIVP